MMIFSSSCQIFLALWLVRACSMDFFLLTNPTFLDNAFLTLKIFGLLFTNFIPVFISKSSRENSRTGFNEKKLEFLKNEFSTTTSTFIRQIFAELLYYIPAFQSKTFLETGSGKFLIFLKAILTHLRNAASSSFAYHTLRLCFFNLLSSSRIWNAEFFWLIRKHGFYGWINRRNCALLWSNFVDNSHVSYPIQDVVLNDDFSYYFLTDLECCKKISFVLFLSILLCLLLCFIFLVVPRKNYVWETLFDFNL